MGRKIIIVDDDRETREMLQVLLELEGYEVKLAANGLRLISTLHVDKPDAILLDVMMSWIDGFELCQAIKKNPEFAAIPLVFISGRTSEADRQRGAERGPNHYSPKPLVTHRWVARLRELADGPPSRSLSTPSPPPPS